MYLKEQQQREKILERGHVKHVHVANLNLHFCTIHVNAEVFNHCIKYSNSIQYYLDLRSSPKYVIASWGSLYKFSG